MPEPGRRDVVVDRVAVREVRDVAGARQRADADARAAARPGSSRTATAAENASSPLPTAATSERALRVRVGDGVRLDRRVGVAVGCTRVAHAAEAEVDHARPGVGGPADRRRLGVERDRRRPASRPSRSAAARVYAMPTIPWRVEVRGDDPGDERPVALGVDARVAADEAARVGDASRRSRAASRRCRSRRPRPSPGASVVGGSGQASKAWSSCRYHCFGASGSVGVNAAAGAARRERGDASDEERRGASARHDLRRARRRRRSRSPAA